MAKDSTSGPQPFDLSQTRTSGRNPDTVLRVAFRGWAWAVVALVTLPFFGDESAGTRVSGLAAQDDPAEVVSAFHDAIAAHQWEDAAATVHAESLDLFRYRLASMLDADSAGRLETLLFGAADGVEVRTRPSTEVFAAILEAIESDTPGLIAVLATNRYDPIGHLLEDPETAHVLLRVTPYTNGSAPSRTAVTTLKRAASGWAIVESGELDSLATAMTGLSITAKSAPGGPGG